VEFNGRVITGRQMHLILENPTPWKEYCRLQGGSDWWVDTDDFLAKFGKEVVESEFEEFVDCLREASDLVEYQIGFHDFLRGMEAWMDERYVEEVELTLEQTLLAEEHSYEWAAFQACSDGSWDVGAFEFCSWAMATLSTGFLHPKDDGEWLKSVVAAIRREYRREDGRDDTISFKDICEMMKRGRGWRRAPGCAGGKMRMEASYARSFNKTASIAAVKATAGKSLSASDCGKENATCTASGSVEARREAERQIIKEEMPTNWRHFCAFQKGEEWRVKARRVYWGVQESGAPDEFLRIFLRELKSREDPGDQSIIFPRFAEAFSIAMKATRVVVMDGEEGSPGEAALKVAAEEGAASPASGSTTTVIPGKLGAAEEAEKEGTDTGAVTAASVATADSDITARGDGVLGQDRVPPDKLEGTVTAATEAARETVATRRSLTTPAADARGDMTTPGDDAVSPAATAASTDKAGAREVPDPLPEVNAGVDCGEGTGARVATAVATGAPAVPAVCTRGPRTMLEATAATAPARKAAEVRPFPGRGKSTFFPGPFSKRDEKAAKVWRECEMREREARKIAPMEAAQAAPRRPRGTGGGLPKSRAGRRLITAAGIGPDADSCRPAAGTQNRTRNAARTVPGNEGAVPTGVAPLGGVLVRARVPPDKAGLGAARRASKRKARPRRVVWTARRLRTQRGPKRVVQKTAQWKRKRMRRRWRRVQPRPRRVQAAPFRGRVRVPPDKTSLSTVECMWSGLPEQQAWLMRLGARMGVG
jgi:hypothetical protein